MWIHRTVRRVESDSRVASGAAKREPGFPEKSAPGLKLTGGPAGDAPLALDRSAIAAGGGAEKSLPWSEVTEEKTATTFAAYSESLGKSETTKGVKDEMNGQLDEKRATVGNTFQNYPGHPSTTSLGLVPNLLPGFTGSGETGENAYRLPTRHPDAPTALALEDSSKLAPPLSEGPVRIDYGTPLPATPAGRPL